MNQHGASPEQQGKRTPEEIMSSILTMTCCNDDHKRGGVTKMKIMAGAFISHETATGYLQKLMQEGLIVYHPGRNTYSTTEQGKDDLIFS